MNKLRKVVYWLALVYFQYGPIQRGKWRLLQWLSSCLGSAEYTRDGFKLFLKPVSLLDRMLITRTDPNPILTEAIESVIWTSGYFLDIGANIGYFSLLAASKGAQVIAFEPSPRELAKLYRNLLASGMTSVVVFPIALSDSEGVLPLTLAEEGNPGLNSLQKVASGAHTIAVKVSPLSKILAPAVLRGVRLVKLDVEGHELNVLRGMHDIMYCFKTTKFVVEITPTYLENSGHKAVQIYDFFRIHGFVPMKGMLNEFHWDETFVPRSLK